MIKIHVPKLHYDDLQQGTPNDITFKMNTTLQKVGKGCTRRIPHKLYSYYSWIEKVNDILSIHCLLFRSQISFLFRITDLKKITGRRDSPATVPLYSRYVTSNYIINNILILNFIA